MKKINLLNIGVRLMHVVTSSQNIFTHICTLTLLTKVGVYWNTCQGYGCSVHMQKVYERCTTLIFPRQSAKSSNGSDWTCTFIITGEWSETENFEVCIQKYLRGGQGKREVGNEGAGEGRWRGGRREKRGGRRERREKEGGREKEKKIRARSARRSKEGGGRQGAGGEVRGGRGERHTLCPSPHTSW